VAAFSHAVAVYPLAARGAWDAADAHLAAARVALREVSGGAGGLWALMAELRLAAARGDHDRAASLGDGLAAGGDRAVSEGIAPWRADHVEALVAAGRPDDARAAAATFVAASAGSPSPLVRTDAARAAAAVIALPPPHDDAGSALGRRPATHRPGTPPPTRTPPAPAPRPSPRATGPAPTSGATGPAQRPSPRATGPAPTSGATGPAADPAGVGAAALLGTDDAAAVEAAVCAALAEPADRVGPYARARLELAAGAAWRRVGERSRAATLLEAARTRFADLRATPYVERADRELAATGVRSAARATAAGAALTAQEQAVCHLVAQGRTNRETAAELFLSVKTVEHHLSRSYAKLGVRSRTALARAMASPTSPRAPVPG
jgi:DNA-binding CsgD family transcriptional regulator